MCEETPSNPAICYLHGGPQDGAEHSFEVLPILLYLTAPYSGFYELTENISTDGARVFEYHAPAA
jgi:hypothetical protein